MDRARVAETPTLDFAANAERNHDCSSLAQVGNGVPSTSETDCQTSRHREAFKFPNPATRIDGSPPVTTPASTRFSNPTD